MHVRTVLQLSFVCALGLTADVVSADAIPPSTVRCPPGLDHVDDHRGGSCVPRGCSTSASCGSGATCREVHECVAVRSTSGRFGRSSDEVRVAICGPGDTCDEGRCRVIHQCEPTAPTPSWDRRMHRWRARRR